MGDEEELPRDAKIVKSLLKSMGVEQYEPRVVHQFLELWYRYIVDILTDAQTYSDHAGKSLIDSDDVKLAIQSKVNFTFSQPPPREILLELARNRNKIPLPKSISGPGIPLPPEQDTLISPNYQLAIPKRQSSQAVEETEEDEEGATNPSSSQYQNPQQQQQQQQPQRVSFPLAAKRPRVSIMCCAIFNRTETSAQAFVQTDTYRSREPVNLQGYCTYSNGPEYPILIGSKMLVCC